MGDAMGTACALGKQTSPLAQLDGVAVRAEVEQMNPCEFIITPKNCGSVMNFYSHGDWRSGQLACFCHAQGREFKSRAITDGTFMRRLVSRLGVHADKSAEGRFSGEKPAQAGANAQTRRSMELGAAVRTGTAAEPAALVRPRVGPDAPCQSSSATRELRHDRAPVTFGDTRPGCTAGRRS